MYVKKADFTQQKLILTIFPWRFFARLGNAALSTSRRPMYVKKADFTEEKLILTIFP